jgi:hypothetical protein
MTESITLQSRDEKTATASFGPLPLAEGLLTRSYANVHSEHIVGVKIRERAAIYVQFIFIPSLHYEQITEKH